MAFTSDNILILLCNNPVLSPFQSDGMDLDKNHSDVDNLSNFDNRKLGSSANEYDTCTTMTISSPEPEEYTYEGAIEGYKSRIISQTNSTIVKTVVNNSKEKSPDKVNGDLNKIRTTVSNKIEEKVSSFNRERVDDRNNNQKKDLPKVDIHKRREQFERENSQESQNKPKLPDIAGKKSIKERLSSLERFTEETQVQKSASDVTKLPTEVRPLKERLSNLEKVKTANVQPEKVKRLSNGDLSNTKSLKERLSSLKSQTSEEEKITKTEVKEVSMSLKERLSCLDAAKNKEIPKISVEEQLTSMDKSAAKEDELNDKINDNSLKSSLSGIESQMQSFCRSLDSLDINGQTSPNSFDRVQSLEDFDCAEIQNNTVQSDIETEDSGIHTARDSCAPADDIADLSQVASPIGEPVIEVSEYESSNEDGTVALEPNKIEEPIERLTEPIKTISEDIIIEEIETNYDTNDVSKADSDSASNYLQAVSQPEELSVTEEVTEIQMDKEDEDTLKSLDTQDTSVSLNEPVSAGSEGDTVVFEGKMTIHLNLNEICNNVNAGAGNGNDTNANETSTTNDSTNRKSMPMVTVSNITTTTNISPKNSIKTLKTLLDNHTLTNKLADVTSTSECSVNNVVNHDPCNNTVNSTSNDNDVNHTHDVTANIDAMVSSSQDCNPFWQKRTKRSIEPNRRKTILFINNKSVTKTVSNSSDYSAKSNV